MGFGADEYVSPDVITETAADVDEEVVRALVAGTELITGEGVDDSVVAGALPADTAHQIKAGFLVDARLVNAVEIENQGTIGNALATIIALAAAPDGIKANADAAMEDHVGADIGIESALFGAEERPGGTVQTALVSTWRGDGSKPKHSVTLLGGREAHKKEKRADHREESKLSQEKPPVLIANSG